MFVCMVFVFAAFLEYSVVNVLARKGRKQLTQDRLCRGQTHKNKMASTPRINVTLKWMLLSGKHFTACYVLVL